MEKITAENFEQIVAGEKGLFIIKFSSPTCGPCRSMVPVFEHLAQNNPELNIYEIDTSESPELAAHFGVRGVPYIAYCENREVIYDFTGLTPLRDLQYVIDNIDDPHFREHGEFNVPKPKQSPWFAIAIVSVLLLFALALYLAS